MLRQLLALASAFLLATATQAHAASPGHPQLSICFISHNGACSGGAGWQFQTSSSDRCGASLLWSQNYGSDVSVWIDDSAPNRTNLDLCEQYYLGRPSYHVFVGNYANNEARLSYGENMMEWYPFHGSSTISPAAANGGCPGHNGNQGFVVQQYFAWPGDYPPTSGQSSQEWGDAIGCIPSGSTEPMGAY